MGKSRSNILQEYIKKREFSNTPEPVGKINVSTTSRQVSNEKVFTVQKHRASRLHYDFRLEDENGIPKSWAVPKGPSLNPQIKRLAVLTEDHPYDYLLFEGTIPKGNYGAGTVIVWDHGTYKIVWDHGTYKSADNLLDQFKSGKISIELYGKKLHGKFSLIRTRNDKQWLLIKSNDEFASNDEEITIISPNSALSGAYDIASVNEKKPRLNTEIQSKSKSNQDKKTNSKYSNNTIDSHKNGTLEEERFPLKIKPMLAIPVDKGFNSKDWAYEIKWDGVRAIVFKAKKENKNNIKLKSRNGNDITMRYPEITEALETLLADSSYAILDGEIVVLDENGLPDFQGHQRRMHVQNNIEIEKLSKEVPTTIFLFDVLYYEGKNIEKLSFMERRKILTQIVKAGERIKISDFFENGLDLLNQTRRLNLEGIMAKRKLGTYKEGARSSDWLKIKNIRTQDCVVIGYTQGEGKRKNWFGSLLLAVYVPEIKKFKFIGHTGSGFDDKTVQSIYQNLQKLKIDTMPIDSIPYKNRATQWVKPFLVAEIKFSSWTKDNIMRAAIFLRFREDKDPVECIVEADQPIAKTVDIVQNKIPHNGNKDSSKKIDKAIRLESQKSNQGFSNIDKTYWKPTETHKRITKGDLINYYESISQKILPHLKDRPLSLNRFPNGIEGKSFYHKDWDTKKPDFVQTIRVHSEHRAEPINYLVCNNKESLLWIANLGSIEMHPWYSRFNDIQKCSTAKTLFEDKCGLNFPDFIVFDLDPYIYSGVEKKGQEPEYNIKGFKAAVEVAFHIKDLFKELKITSFVKTSGKTGLHIYVPIKTEYTYDQSRAFAEIIGKILLSRFPQKVTMEWSTTKRTGKVFFDYNQNSRGKTIASVYSVRPTSSATVSMPIEWNCLNDITPGEFTLLSVPQLINGNNDPWKGVLEQKQDLRKLLSKVEDKMK
jgi:bifunctional non-homologous end joining protein LigD